MKRRPRRPLVPRLRAGYVPGSSELMGLRIRDARLAALLSQAELAEKAGLAQAALSRIERGQTVDPGLHVVAGIARALGLALIDLVDGATPREPRLTVSHMRDLAERVRRLEELVDRLGGRPG